MCSVDEDEDEGIGSFISERRERVLAREDLFRALVLKKQKKRKEGK